MLKLRRYTKPFLMSILIIVALLFGQAMCELAMPDYMSDIVNIGINAGGIEEMCIRDRYIIGFVRGALWLCHHEIY